MISELLRQRRALVGHEIQHAAQLSRILALAPSTRGQGSGFVRPYGALRGQGDQD